MRDVHYKLYRDRRIGRGGPIAWPPVSSVLNPLHFYLWEHLKSRVYAASVDNEETLHHRIVDPSQPIHNYLSIFEMRWLSVMRRVEACNESHGEHFEHLYSFSYNPHIKCFRTYV
jgi:hypothetical protein